MGKSLKNKQIIFHCIFRVTASIQYAEDDDDDDVDDVPVKNSFQAKFAFLASDDDEQNNNDDDENDDEQPSATTTIVSVSSKKKNTKKKGQGSKVKKGEEEIDSLLADIESVNVSSKKAASNKKNKPTNHTTINKTVMNDDDFKEGEGQDLEDLLKVIQRIVT
jgi:hypothetical protein